MEQHIIVCGLGRVGGRVLEYLRAAGVTVLVIDNRVLPNDSRLGGAALLSGDCCRAESWQQANLDRAQGVLILTSDDLVNISTALMVRKLNPNIRIVVRMFNQGLMDRLGHTVHNVFALSTSALAAPLLALMARTGKALGTFRLDDGAHQQVSELVVQAQSVIVGRSVAEVMQPEQLHAIAYCPARGAAQLGSDVDLQARLSAGDQMVVCGEADRVAALLGQVANVSLPELRWAGFLRRTGRMLWVTLREVDLPVKICTAVLVGVIILSVLVFHLSMKKDTLVDAFYRTISLIATGADMDVRELEPGAWQKAFISMLRLVGLALVASFTAILTNYLVRAHLRGALEVRRIPERGHIIVCGLGNVGFRVVQELLRQDERVVAIERSRDSSFIPTARRQGTAVIVGDATIKEVLKQANGGAARAVVAATSNDLANLEIALLVRELDPQIRVVLRLTDPQLAWTLREAANVQLAVSIPELAGPAFVAALFGERVRSVFSVGDRLLAVIDLAVYPDDPLFAGKTVEQLQRDHRFVALALRRGEQVTKGSLDGMAIEAGDRLTVIMALVDLQRLLRQEKVPEPKPC